jgi:hypothetical protein
MPRDSKLEEVKVSKPNFFNIAEDEPINIANRPQIRRFPNQQQVKNTRDLLIAQMNLPKR